MLTHESELTTPTDLCTPDGRRLNPQARGWSRTPLIRANLRGRWGRTKRWDYWAIVTDELTVALTYADLDYLGVVSVYWVDLATGRDGGREVTVPFARGLDLPDVPGGTPLCFRHHHLGVEVADDATGSWLTARWREPDASLGRLDARVTQPTGHQSVNVVIPWSETRFQYTSKQQARPATGELVVGDDRWPLGAGGSHAWGVLDVGRGRWPYRTRWNWGAGAGTAVDGRTVGLQVGGIWTVGTGATENGVIVDGEVVKIGEELDWRYDERAPMEPWQVRSTDGALDVRLLPRHLRHARTEALMVRSEMRQVFGSWSGHVPTPQGGRVAVDRLAGFVERSDSRW